TPVTSGTIALSAGAAAKLGFTNQPTATTAGAFIDGGSGGILVAQQDQFGNTVTSPRIFITLAINNNAGGGSLSGTVTQRTGPANGIATFNDLSINKTGVGYTLQATSAGLSSGTSAGFDITPAAADHLAFSVQPSNTIGGQTITPAVV